LFTAAGRKTAHLVPTWQDLEVLEATDKALSPLADFTDMFSEKNVTFSALIPILKQMEDNKLSRNSDDTASFASSTKDCNRQEPLKSCT